MADSPNKSDSFEIRKLAPRLDQLIGQWNEEVTATQTRREVRKKEINVAEERSKGTIAPDETIIVRRVIDKNIRNEKPEYIAYLEQSTRLCLFKDRQNPVNDTIALADWFTQGMRYQGWNMPWHRLFDATLLHGGAALEVRYNVARPFNLEIVYCPRESLIFPRKLKGSIQKCETIIRQYEYLPNELEDAIKTYDFSAEAVKEITKNCKESHREELFKAYKVFRKKDGIVYVGWYSDLVKDRWLKDFTPLQLGLFDPNGNPKPINIFPFFFNSYELIEEEEVLNVKGRAARDLPDQDALTQLWSSVVNGTTRAANLQASRVNDPTNADQGQAEPIQPNTVAPRELSFYQAAYPDSIILQVAQQLSTENLAASGRVDFAVSNRKDARKTRAEIVTAREQQAELSSINIVPAAQTITEIYSFIWELVREQVITGYITPPDYLAPELFNATYDILPAGDIEVLKRAEKIASFQQDIPLLANTPLMPHVLRKYIELRYPDEALQWREVLAVPDLRPIVAGLVQILSALPVNNLSQQDQAQLAALIQHATSALASSGTPSGAPAMAAQSTNPNPAQAAPA